LEDVALEEGHILAIQQVMHLRMDAEDEEGVWELEPDSLELWEPECAEERLVEVIVDSGADVSVAPWWCNGAGHEAVVGPLLLHDAQGEQIAHSGARVLDLKMSTTSGGQVVIKEKFAVANVNAVIMSLGRLLRAGWSLRTQDYKHYLYNGSDEVEIQLRKNTMVVPAVVRAIGLLDKGPLPVVLEEIAAGGGQGWHVLPSGLPVLIARQVEEIPGGESAWNAADWPWVAVFVRVGNKERGCAQGDVWAQVLTKKVEDFLEEEKVLRRLDDP
jgi:hypothetical protein